MISMRYSCFIGALISSSSYHQVLTSSNWKEIHWRSSVVFLLHPNTHLSCIHFLALMSSPTILAKSYYFTNLDFSEIWGISLPKRYLLGEIHLLEGPNLPNNSPKRCAFCRVVIWKPMRNPIPGPREWCQHIPSNGNPGKSSTQNCLGGKGY